MAVDIKNSEYLANEYNIKVENNLVRVIIELKEFEPEYIKVLENGGAIIEIYDANLVQARLPVSRLNEFANLPFVNFIRIPEDYSTLSVTSEGVATINATELHKKGINGSGVKIGVIDLGFQDYQNKLGTELPLSVEVKSFRQDGDITGMGEKHGTAVAETVFDVAPGAKLYLVNFQTDLEKNNAVNWLISQHVDIISASTGKMIGPKDGTDYSDKIVNNSTKSGILWVNSAGNEAEEHWMGNFYDPDVNKFHNFTSVSEIQTIIGISGQQIEILLDWNDWPYSDQDYDLYIIDKNLNLVASSQNVQSGSQPPVERIRYTASYTGYYGIVIKKYMATRNVKFHLYSPKNPTMRYIVPAGSITIPGMSKDSLTVGATHWLNDALEPYSSRGPTDDGRIKPDVVAPANTTNSVYGVFMGTSASAPHVSGAAALLLQANRSLNISQLRYVLESSAKDLGPPGKDNLFGTGRIDVFKAYQMVTTTPTCAYDLNGDKTIGIGDVVVLVNNWNAKNADPAWDQKKFADLNKDGEIGIGDVVVLVNNWGKNC